MIEIRSGEPGAPAAVQAVLVHSARGVDGSDIRAQLADPCHGLSAELVELARLFLSQSPMLGHLGEVKVLPCPAHQPSVLLFVDVGTGTAAELRGAAAALSRATAGYPDLTVTGLAARSHSAPDPVSRRDGASDGARALTEGLLLGGYRFTRAAAAPAPATVRSVTLIGADPTAVGRGRVFAESTMWARELTNTRSDIKTPAWLARQARETLGGLAITITERDEQWLRQHRFGGVLAVGAGSAAPPRLIEASWRPRRAAGSAPPTTQHIVLVGKGITYDTGGLNIKALESMSTMHTDMAGGAAVLAAVRIVAQLALPIRVTALVPAAENSVSGSAMRPGAVVRHYGGRTSEIGNTDAEGRLVLGDALAYAVARLKPTAIVDIATLTGAMKVALGAHIGGLFATDDELAEGLLAAAAATGEPLWRMPLAEVYQPLLRSEIADANNSAGNPGAVTAALFLRPFAADIAWAHLDIAGPARSNTDDGILSQGATGFGARLLAQWLVTLADADADADADGVQAGSSDR